MNIPHMVWNRGKSANWEATTSLGVYGIVIYTYRSPSKKDRPYRLIYPDDTSSWHKEFEDAKRAANAHFERENGVTSWPQEEVAPGQFVDADPASVMNVAGTALISDLRKMLGQRAVIDADEVREILQKYDGGVKPKAAQDSVREAAALILSQPKAPDSPIAQPFRIACGYLSGEECGDETTNEIIETFLRALAGKGGA